MPGIDIGGAFAITGYDGGVAAASQAFDISAGATALLDIDVTGRTRLPNQIGFSAALATDPGWVAMPSGVYTPQTYMNATSFNYGGGYNTANGRFTAPVAGAYLFHACCYMYKPSVGPGNYVYAVFAKNGSQIPNYHIEGYWNPAGYSFSAELCDIMALAANDYVEYHIYATAGVSCYRLYTGFSGWLIG